MNIALVLAGSLAVVGAAAHSYFGERYIIIPLTRRDDLPHTPLGDDKATARMLRSTWHFFTVAVLSVAGVLFAFAQSSVEGGGEVAVRILAVYAAVFAVFNLVRSRGRHFVWLLGSGMAAAAWIGTL